MAATTSAHHAHESAGSHASAKGRPLSEVGMTPAEAKELRARLSSFAREWDDPRMDIYNDAQP